MQRNAWVDDAALNAYIHIVATAANEQSRENSVWYVALDWSKGGQVGSRSTVLALLSKLTTPLPLPSRAFDHLFLNKLKDESVTLAELLPREVRWTVS